MNDALVAVGIGNTTITLGVYQPDTAAGDRASWTTPRWTCVRHVTIETAGFDPSQIDLEIPDSAAWRIASVHRPSEQRLANWVRNSTSAVSYRNLIFSDLPIAVRVVHPERVGMDRLAAAVAVNQRRNPQASAVIVDAGTAITVDLVNPRGDFLGGAILPGMRLVSQALATKTDQLPIVEPDFRAAVPDPLGTSTEAAIRSGLFWGSVGAIRELVARIGDETPGTPEVYLTGGDAERVAPYITGDAVFVRDLVLQGILASEQ